MNALTARAAWLALCLAPWAHATPPTTSKDSFVGNGGARVAVQVVSAPASSAQLQVLYPPAVVAVQDTPATLQGMAGSKMFVRPVDKWRSLFNAGFSSSRYDVPVGLLVTEGKVRSPIDSSPPRTGAGADCPAAAGARFRFSGILCVRADTQRWEIMRTQDYQPGACREAVQAGPLLVEPGGALGICEAPAAASAAPSPRTAVCIDAENRLHLIRSEATLLHPFARWLAEGPLKCQVALNLSGAEQSGWIRLSTTRRQIPDAQGSVQAALPSALLLKER